MHSKLYARIKNWYDKGIWTKSMVQNAADKGVITAEEYEEIVGEPYTPSEEEATVKDYEDGMRELGVIK